MDLNFAPQSSEPHIFWKAQALLTKPNRVLNCAVSGALVLLSGMVDLGRILFDLEIVSDHWRCQEAVNIAISVEDEPGAGEITPITLRV
ncbi:MAG: hypothetical protein MRJ66_12470 [Nitrospira sp.]|nr:hypothetical protein [Nitrospira sp.]